ncbi:DNA-binding transcriptional LysR family regulator [Spinactinospora alkalitolerans]|uniref:DNA-binding transcriptional LysR family regulator n=1 Tax=Spinactinospora alkalitolerans TaxID=687207 RepID=A0A852U3V9_9ACTN|nr:LysR family transcriptional regulator [Spinactinospora alkalitolerans]NYE50277.1 DNA-binding transcriptional LysR family regulator [Spinactinospora alkalitolerans]
MKEITLRQLEYFLAVAELGSISAAARRCHVSAGGISLALNELEAGLGVQLMLRRKAKGAVLTAAGRWVAEQARSIVRDTKELQYGAQMLQGRLVGPLNIGCFSTLSPWLLPRIVEHFSLNHPDVDVDLVEGPSDHLQRLLHRGEIDVCLMYSKHVETDLEYRIITPVRLQVLLSADHPLAGLDEVSLNDLRDEPAVLLGLRPARDLAETVLRSAGFEPWIKWRSTNVETIRSIVARGLAYSVLMGRPLGDRTYEGLPVAYRRIKDDLPANSVIIAHPRGSSPSAKVQTLIDYCRGEFGSTRAPGLSD